jgi:hypothetical protein
MKSNKTKVSILIGILVILLLPLMAGCLDIRDYYDCNTVIHEGEIAYSMVSSSGDSVTFKDGFSFSPAYIFVIVEGEMARANPTYGYSYKLLRCSNHPQTLLLIPSTLPNPTQYTPFNPQKDCDCDK